MDSRMHDTPANYNLQNQRMDSIEDELYDPIDEIAESEEPRKDFDEFFSQRPGRGSLKKKKKKKKKVVYTTVEVLKPTDR